MWVFSKIGFYSAVQKQGCRPDEVEVRSRCRGDLERLNRAVKGDYKIISNEGTDYPYRIRLSKSVWAEFCYDQAVDIDYNNFKNTIDDSAFETKAQQNRRHYAYMGVWKAMLALEDTLPKKGRRTWSSYQEEHFHDRDSGHCLPEPLRAPPASKRKAKVKDNFKPMSYWGK